MDTYAQNCEDLVISVLLRKKKGFYVDVGANLPDTDSVTKIFYDKGWRGINIEPISSLHKRLAKERPRDINLNVGVSNKVGKLKLREYQDGAHGWSTFSSTIKNLSSRMAKPHKDYIVPVRTLADIFEEYKVQEIDFMKVDVEGFEFQVLESNDWGRWKPKIVVVENTPGKWHALLKKQGYIEVFFDNLNRYFATPTVHSQLELVLKDIRSLISEEFNQLLLEREKELEEAKLLSNRVIESPEDYLSFRKLSKAQLIQIKRRLGI